MIAAGWYTPIGPPHGTQTTDLVWGIAILISFLLGYLCRGRQRQVETFLDVPDEFAGGERDPFPEDEGLGFSPGRQSELKGLSVRPQTWSHDSSSASRN